MRVMSTLVNALSPIATASTVAVVLSGMSMAHVLVAGSNWFTPPATVTHTTKRTARRPVKDTM